MARAKFEATPENIKKFRDDRGWSRAKLGKALRGVPENTIRNWEKGTATPPAFLAQAMLYVSEKSIGGTIKAHAEKERKKADDHDPSKIPSFAF